MEYTVDYFIKKFEAIPDNRWCVGELMNKAGQCCAYGHCGMREYDTEAPEADALMKVERKLPSEPTCFASINNGEHPAYQQETPRLRILAALRDIKAKGASK